MHVERSVRRTGKDRAGFVLVAVLSVTSLLALLIGGASLLTRGAVDAAGIDGGALRTEALLRSGLELAGHQLFVLRTDPAALTGQQLRLDTGTVTIFTAAEAARVDLNGADPVLLGAAYRAAGLGEMTPEDFAARVVDWRGTGSPAIGSNAAAPAVSFRTEADLRYVPGVTAADVAALAPFVTVFNPGGRIDPMFAPPALLEALPGVPSDLSARLADARAQSGLDRLFRLRALFRGLEQHLVLGEPLRVFRVRIEAREALGGGASAAEAVLIASILSDRPFQVTDWHPL